MTKEVMWSQLEVGQLQAGIDLENRTQMLSSFTGDMREAVAAFVEKRAAAFRCVGRRAGLTAKRRDGLTTADYFTTVSPFTVGRTTWIFVIATDPPSCGVM